MLIQSAGPVAQYLVARELEVHFPLPGRSRKTCPVRFVHHCDDSTSTANRLVSSDLRFESLKRSPNVVLRNVAWGSFLEEIVEHILRQPSWPILPHFAVIVWVSTGLGFVTGLAVLYRNAPASIRAGHFGG